MPVQDIKWKAPECTSVGCQKRRRQETRGYGTNDTTENSIRDALECRAWVTERGAWREGVAVCQAEEGARQTSKAGRARKKASNREAGELYHPEPKTRPWPTLCKALVSRAGPRE